DADRQPWLDSLASGVEQWQSEDQGAVIACSALKESYRTKLINHSQRVKLVYLKASYEEIHKRLEQRKNHFMKADMLKSQFATLEEPKDAIVVQACLDLETIVEKVKAALETNEHT
ncbi:MAG: hypothetical protein WCT03_16485, partial [Candidatus Obscuribacterales bacterium]